MLRNFKESLCVNLYGLNCHCEWFFAKQSLACKPGIASVEEHNFAMTCIEIHKTAHEFAACDAACDAGLDAAVPAVL